MGGLVSAVASWLLHPSSAGLVTAAAAVSVFECPVVLAGRCLTTGCLAVAEVVASSCNLLVLEDSSAVLVTMGTMDSLGVGGTYVVDELFK